MKVLFDTSVLVAALVQPHPAHQRALPWFGRASSGKLECVVSAYSIAELYAVLTTLPVSPRITAGMAHRLIHENIESMASIIPLSVSDYLATIKHLADLGIIGGSTYDALIIKAALKAGVDQILTFNSADFKRVWPDSNIPIKEP
nr:MAG: hypothetical protein A2X56_00785 [Nitrospirae bacterium GWC2_57_13]OGW43411.1 MAG: hypothetical protein A2X57_10925 [Nitrospirae bacterium GWD2_57_8]HAR45221.1 VapC toxin family PIN domain ribonuclease [Nitrospiraceae bacterium]HAS53932.1 VapC toxin family PIN domain ribonuclease [Nitrospiraceae bacterium]